MARSKRNIVVEIIIVRAATALIAARLPAAALAAGNAVGYDGEAAFSRAYKRAMGVSPGQVRREVAAAAETPLTGMVGV
jgi:transcriptional regulator GlxA family with amidase domain